MDTSTAMPMARKGHDYEDEKQVSIMARKGTERMPQDPSNRFCPLVIDA